MIKKMLLIVFCYGLLSSFLSASIHVGRVVGVYDGDTVTVLEDEKRQLKVRLAEIDTPELAQPYGRQAKMALSDLVFGKTVTVNVQDRDRYGRYVAHLYVDTMDVNAEMLRRGAAWVYRQYATDPQLYVLETQAKKERQGLWGLSEAERVAPWEWRRMKQRKAAQK